MNIQAFSDGSFVIHGITGHWKGKMSAWFSSKGEMSAAEQIIGSRTRPIKKFGPMWHIANRKGMALASLSVDMRADLQ